MPQHWGESISRPSSRSPLNTVFRGIFANPGFYCVVAEADGKVVGSNFLDERNPISGVGPISVSPAVQNQTIGRDLMRAVMDRSAARGFAGCRLPQSLVVPLYEARFRHPRTALQDVRAAAPRHACGIRSAPGERALSGG